MLNYTRQGYITKYTGNGVPVIARIMNINTTRDRVQLVRFGWVNVADCQPPLAVGDPVMVDDEVYTVNEVADSEDGFSVAGWRNFTISNGCYIDYVDGTELNFELISGSEIPEAETGLTKKTVFKEVKEFLNDCKYSFSPNVISGIVENAYAAKEKLREKFRKSEYWNEELQALIIPNFTFENSPDYSLVKNKVKEIICAMYNILDERINEPVYYSAINVLETYIYKNKVYLNDANAQTLEINLSKYKYSAGQKVSKFFRGVFDAINPDGYDNYEHDYAILADAASPKTMLRTLVISLNLMDFLTMSEGNSWDSCHNIHKRGCYHGGCLSYALDEVTAILYTLPADVDISEGGLWRHKKINRQLFMFGDTLVIESRLYPKHEDGNIRNAHHKIVNKIYNEIMGKRFNPVKGSNSAISDLATKVTRTVGLHYPDYKYDCYHIAIMKSDDYSSERITIGSESPDIVSGEINNNHERMTEYNNTTDNHSLAYEDYDSGELIFDEEYAEVVDGYVYHRDNLVWCEHEDTYATPDDVVWIGDYAYTKGYADENLVRCTHCDEYIFADDAIYTADGDAYCEECASDYLSQCVECGEYYRADDMEYIDDEYVCSDCLDIATKVCSVCGERHFNSFFAEGSTVCSDCAEITNTVELSEGTVVMCSNIKEVKAVLKAASEKDLYWRSGEPAQSKKTVDIIRRTLLNPNIDQIGIVIKDVLSYAVKGNHLTISDDLGNVINFADLTTTTA